ncbi:MAG: endonuclease III [Candidatus Micrarchaeota archaeon]|nr:endonuclease III [Candidatus Micrarchaeota archaeon]MDE1864422.1 endonuclease III [Candidatus Micrarchaeota archaeon]
MRDFPVEVMERLLRRYDLQKETMLEYSSPSQLLIATTLSPQCTDKQVNKVTRELFKKYRGFADYAKADIRKLQKDLSGINYYKTKARHIKEAARIIESQFNGKLPSTIDELMILPGVGRKVANVVLTNGMGITEGIAIDTHCITVANRLRLTGTRNPAKIEADLMRRIPKKYWLHVSNLFVTLGRDACKASKKECWHCTLNDICPSSNFNPRKN